MSNRNRGFHSPSQYLVLGIGLGIVLVGFWAAYATPAFVPCPGPLTCTYVSSPDPQPLGLLLLIVDGFLFLSWALILGFVHLLRRYVPSRPPTASISR